MIGRGVFILWGSKIAISHWQSQSPLTQGWRYRAARDDTNGKPHAGTGSRTHWPAWPYGHRKWPKRQRSGRSRHTTNATPNCTTAVWQFVIDEYVTWFCVCVRLGVQLPPMKWFYFLDHSRNSRLIDWLNRSAHWSFWKHSLGGVAETGGGISFRRQRGRPWLVPLTLHTSFYFAQQIAFFCYNNIYIFVSIVFISSLSSIFSFFPCLKKLIP